MSAIRYLACLILPMLLHACATTGEPKTTHQAEGPTVASVVTQEMSAPPVLDEEQRASLDTALITASAINA